MKRAFLNQFPISLIKTCIFLCYNFIIYFVLFKLQYFTSTLCCLNKRHLENSDWPKSRNIADWVSDHRKHHSRLLSPSDEYFLDFLPHSFWNILTTKMTQFTGTFRYVKNYQQTQIFTHAQVHHVTRVP